MLADLGAKLKRARMRTGMKQQEVANILGVTSQAVSSYEAAGSNPNAETLAKLCSIYGESPEYLLGLSRTKALFTDGLDEDEIDNLHSTAELFRRNKEK